MASPESRVFLSALPGEDKPDGAYVVDHHVPMPPGREKLQTKYPFPEMAVGDSFAFDEAGRYRVANAARFFVKSRQPLWRYAVRKTAPGVCRCWRVA